jgi:hypothetical protein
MVKTQARLDVAFCCAESLVVPGGGARRRADQRAGARASAPRRQPPPPPPPSPPPPPPRQVPSPKLSHHSQVSRLTAAAKVVVEDNDDDDDDDVEVLTTATPSEKRRRLLADDDSADGSTIETLHDMMERVKRADGERASPPPLVVVDSRTDTMLREQRENVTRLLKRKGIDVAPGSDIDQLMIEHNLFDELANSGAVTQSPAVDEPAESTTGAQAATGRADPTLLWPEPEQLWQAATTYTLHAVTYHHGRRASSGHYVTAVRKAKNKWTLYNDSSVKDENEDDALHSIANKREGYIYFFVHNSQLAANDVDRI